MDDVHLGEHCVILDFGFAQGGGGFEEIITSFDFWVRSDLRVVLYPSSALPDFITRLSRELIDSTARLDFLPGAIAFWRELPELMSPVL